MFVITTQTARISITHTSGQHMHSQVLAANSL